MTVKLTLGQRKRLEWAAMEPRGLVVCRAGKGWGKHSWEKMMEILQERGLVKPYVHGGYEITDAGRALVARPHRK